MLIRKKKIYSTFYAGLFQCECSAHAILHCYVFIAIPEAFWLLERHAKDWAAAGSVRLKSSEEDAEADGSGGDWQTRRDHH